MARRAGFHPPKECPVCGEDVPPKARACPHCGADERSGWNEEDTSADGLNLPGDAGMDYDDFMEREFGVRKRKHLWIPITAGILLIVWVIWELAH